MLSSTSRMKRVPATKGGFGRLNVAPILAKGFGVATLYYGDIDPDFLGGVPLGVRGLYSEPAPDEWGSISAWASPGWARSQARRL